MPLDYFAGILWSDVFNETIIEWLQVTCLQFEWCFHCEIIQSNMFLNMTRLFLLFSKSPIAVCEIHTDFFQKHSMRNCLKNHRNSTVFVTCFERFLFQKKKQKQQKKSQHVGEVRNSRQTILQLAELNLSIGFVHNIEKYTIMTTLSVPNA